MDLVSFNAESIHQSPVCCVSLIGSPGFRPPVRGPPPEPVAFEAPASGSASAGLGPNNCRPYVTRIYGNDDYNRFLLL
jgi:hypothetical protein